MDKFYVARQLTKDDSTIVSAPLTDAQSVIMKCRRLFSVHVDGEPTFEGTGEACTRRLHLVASSLGLEVNGLFGIDDDGNVRMSIHAKGD